ncbi:hypothetical protein EZV62_005601 [Acer yangbiense]|uniref:Uncharacterized protein n=1 Tax=Acer yangbiense TaxID=1000413 RepID=A0A5C7IQC9_9ROSI|nr:hypothetical protein EZV62_005601 [Acer yangbiense]
MRPGPAPDQISLRPLGHTGISPEHFSPIPGQERDKEVVAIVGSPKTGKFVPPHLRPGFAGREEKPVPEVSWSRESGQKYFGSPSRYGEDGRPKSGGYERMGRGGESDLGLMNRPRSSGNRPSSSESCDVIFFGSIPMHGSRNNNSVLEYNGGENLILDPRLRS